VVRDKERGRVIFEGMDFYPAPFGEPYGTDDLGAFLRNYVPGVKHGCAIARESYEEIKRVAVEDPDFVRMTPQRRWDD